MYGSNSVFTILADMGAAISSFSEAAASPLEKAFAWLLSLNLVLWFFMPFVLLILIWRVSAVAGRLGKVASAVSRLPTVLGDVGREQTSALHHLRDKTQSSMEALQGAVNGHRDAVQAAGRDVAKGLDRLDSHLQSGADDVVKQLGNIYNRIDEAVEISRGGAEPSAPKGPKLGKAALSEEERRNLP